MQDETISKAQKLKTTILLLLLGSPMLIVLVIWLVQDSNRFFTEHMGFNSTALEIPLAWVLAVAVAVGYVGYTAKQMPEVRQTMFRFDLLKVVAIFTTVIGAGIVEELIFRQLLMNWLYSQGLGTILQIAISGLVFGIGHGIWGLFSKGGSKSMAVGAVIATTILGTALAIIFIVAERNVLPAIFAHALINFCNEPGMMLYAVKQKNVAEDVTTEN
ncbi:MAG: CPBP family intramembrane metalloprotease [Defluviitaleaceae bacterium]|nr:CPBP family intramembrane metalloprotease [Defluviitaleaceae bacterium]